MSQPTRFKKQFRQKLDSDSKIYQYGRSLYRAYTKLTGPFHVFPDFLIIGAARSGTLRCRSSVGRAVAERNLSGAKEERAARAGSRRDESIPQSRRRTERRRTSCRAQTPQGASFRSI